jgi:hypothetical protein
MFTPPLLNNLHQQKNRITEATATVMPNVLQEIWQVMDY